MSIEIDPKEVLKYLNELGYYDITGQQLKDFIKDLKILIKHDYKKNKENVVKNYLDSYNVDNLEETDVHRITRNINTRPAPRHNDYYPRDVFSNLLYNSTVSSRAKSANAEKRKARFSTTPCQTNLPHIPSVSSISRAASLKSVPNCSPSCSQTKSAPESLKFRTSYVKNQKIKQSNSDPVSMYQKYEECWRKQKLPGEDKRQNLRWAVREKMLSHPDVQPRVSMETIMRKKKVTKK